MKYLKTIFLVISTFMSMSSMAAQYLCYNDLPLKAKQRAVKWSKKSRIFDGLTPEEIAIELGWIVGTSIPATPSEAREKIKRASTNKKELAKPSSTREGFDSEMIAYATALHIDPSMVWHVVQRYFKTVYDTADREERKGLLWIASARYKTEFDTLRPFEELGAVKDELVQRAHERGILPHQFGEWFDELPAGDENVKGIYLLIKVMGLPEDLAAEAMTTGLSYDDFELIVDSKKTVDPIHTEIERRSSGAARAAATGSGGAAAATVPAVPEPEDELSLRGVASGEPTAGPDLGSPLDAEELEEGPGFEGVPAATAGGMASASSSHRRLPDGVTARAVATVSKSYRGRSIGRGRGSGGGRSRRDARSAASRSAFMGGALSEEQAEAVRQSMQTFSATETRGFLGENPMMKKGGDE